MYKIIKTSAILSLLRKSEALEEIDRYLELIKTNYGCQYIIKHKDETTLL